MRGQEPLAIDRAPEKSPKHVPRMKKDAMNRGMYMQAVNATAWRASSAPGALGAAQPRL